MNDILKVSSKSKASSLAGAIAGTYKEDGQVEIQAIGAGAVNQAIKGITIARGILAPSGIDLYCVPSFTNVIIDGNEKTAIKIEIR